MSPGCKSCRVVSIILTVHPVRTHFFSNLESCCLLQSILFNPAPSPDMRSPPPPPPPNNHTSVSVFCLRRWVIVWTCLRSHHRHRHNHHSRHHPHRIPHRRHHIHHLHYLDIASASSGNYRRGQHTVATTTVAAASAVRLRYRVVSNDQTERSG